MLLHENQFSKWKKLKFIRIPVILINFYSVILCAFQKPEEKVKQWTLTAKTKFDKGIPELLRVISENDLVLVF